MAKTLIVGSFAPHTLELSYVRAFEALGIQVARFDFDVEGKLVSRVMRGRVGARLSRVSFHARRLLSAKYNAAFVQRCREEKPDLVLVIYTSLLFPETIKAVRNLGCPVVAYQPDNPYPPFNSSFPETLISAKAFSRYYVWSERLALQLREQAIPAQFLPFAWDPVLTPYSPHMPKEASVVFIGGWDRERAAFLERLLRDFNIEIWGGPYWGTRTNPFSRVRRAWKGRLLLETEMAETYAKSAISLNILRVQHSIGGSYDGVIMRTFEVPGAGGFLLSSRSGGATELFPENQSGAYFGSLEDCGTAIETFLQKPQLRLEIAREAHKVTAEKHLYMHRAQEMWTAEGLR